MELAAIIAATLGLSEPWRVTSIVFSSDRKRLDVTVDYDPSESRCCPHCGMPVQIVSGDSATWVHQDFFHYETYLHTRIPRFSCCHNLFNVEPPWAKGSKFVMLQ